MIFERACNIPKWPKIYEYLNYAKHVRKLLYVKKASLTNDGAVFAAIALAIVKKYLIITEC